VLTTLSVFAILECYARDSPLARTVPTVTAQNSRALDHIIAKTNGGVNTFFCPVHDVPRGTSHAVPHVPHVLRGTSGWHEHCLQK